jgi:hypothetical protein
MMSLEGWADFPLNTFASALKDQSLAGISVYTRLSIVADFIPALYENER